MRRGVESVQLRKHSFSGLWCAFHYYIFSNMLIFVVDISMEKSESIELTYEIGQAELLDLPESFERDAIIEGKVSVLHAVFL